MWRRILGLLDCWAGGRPYAHVCDEFTRWRTMEAEFERVPVDMSEKIIAGFRDRIRFRRRWQERECTICGKIQQRELPL